jgi:four helix bundle protein
LKWLSVVGCRLSVVTTNKLQQERGFMAGKSYQDLETWQRAMDLVAEVYEETKKFPREELYGLTNQMRRASVSIPSNIAEGQGRDSVKEFLHHLAIADGSLCETETQILIATRLKYLEAASTAKLLSRTGEVGRLLNGLSRSLARP